jgi:hypothetical protein
MVFIKITNFGSKAHYFMDKFLAQDKNESLKNNKLNAKAQ